MERGTPPSLFVNDGSFMERFKQLQQGKDNEKVREKGSTVVEESKPIKIVSGTSTPKISLRKPVVDTQKSGPATSGGKLAFSLKQKSKVVAPPVKFGADDDEDETDAENGSSDAPMKRQKLGQPEASEESSRQAAVAPPSPSDPTVKKVADKLASFVAKHGRQFEDVTRQKNPGDTPFKFLFDESCADYKYYEYRLAEEEKTLSQSTETRIPQSGGMSTSASKSINVSQRTLQQQNYQTPASALYETAEEPRTSLASTQAASSGGPGSGESSGPPTADPIAMMEFYMKKAAQEEKRRQPKQSKDEMPPPSSLQGPPAKRGHHMGDYIPLEELEKFMATCNDAGAQKAAKEAADRARIQADNIGHKLLSKMGWKEGEGLGSSRSGIADPIMAGDVKTNHLGVGAHNPGEVAPDDDIYEQYKKRMMLGYRHRPNPMNNPRKAYY
ncbi:SURP and G-patch domain-containing protein 1-like protein [Mangifera indica]|uniref:SURP and G-patch domain-containing protein 1-like protein n=1 Tax=Mangifera indica TaxID=29780 RepID=UPI001CFAB4C1|nr:SURP and G-patch domain-containing protein 1-like protein [Mangifera indica]XP_044490411.1 SURP and G-patch domain-containing protein 1-like protein [Mangifera indica]XP_044490413.1 SURP and G-patch domain-containing protein 1-like protein [Mangifera indica]